MDETTDIRRKYPYSGSSEEDDDNSHMDSVSLSHVGYSYCCFVSLLDVSEGSQDTWNISREGLVVLDRWLAVAGCTCLDAFHDDSSYISCCLES